MYKIVVEIPEGWGGYFTVQKMEIPGRRGGLREIPSVVGVWIFSGTTQYNKQTENSEMYKITARKTTQQNDLNYARITIIQ